MMKKPLILFLLPIIFFVAILCLYQIKINALNLIPDYQIAYIEEGKTDTKGGTAADASLFEAGSIGKVITAYICLKLVDEGKLKLEEPIVNYLDKSFITKDQQVQHITVMDLLSHRAGFSTSYELGIDKRIYFEPGSRFHYSGVGYIYLQNVIENVTGMDFEQAANTYVFNPLGMNSSTFRATHTVTPYLSLASLVLYTCIPWMIISFLLGCILLLVKKIFHVKFLTKQLIYFSCIADGWIVTAVLLAVILPRLLLSLFMEAGIFAVLMLFLWKSKTLQYVGAILYMMLFIVTGFSIKTVVPLGPAPIKKEPCSAYSFVTNASDMALFANELIEDYNSNQGLTSEMFTPQIDINDKNSWGAGIGIEQNSQCTTYWHSGINPGMQSLFAIDPDNGKGVIILTNSDYGLTFAKETASKMLGVNGKWDIPR